MHIDNGILPCPVIHAAIFCGDEIGARQRPQGLSVDLRSFTQHHKPFWSTDLKPERENKFLCVGGTGFRSRGWRAFAFSGHAKLCHISGEVFAGDTVEDSCSLFCFETNVLV